MSKDIQEEIIVLFHAALVGRADIVQVLTKIAVIQSEIWYPNLRLSECHHAFNRTRSLTFAKREI